MELSRSSMKLQVAVDYGELVCSVYYVLKEEVERAKEERKKAFSAFYYSLDAGGGISRKAASDVVPVVSVPKGKRLVTILDPDLWLRAIDAALEFVKNTRGLEVEKQIEGYYLRNKANGKPKPVECTEFLFGLAAEAAARGLVDLVQ